MRGHKRVAFPRREVTARWVVAVVLTTVADLLLLFAIGLILAVVAGDVRW